MRSEPAENSIKTGFSGTRESLEILPKIGLAHLLLSNSVKQKKRERS
jgi:hypothetical protein